jgi:hypothetical protein
MENTQNPKSQKPEIAETEVYFNSLLKSQEESQKNASSIKKSKLISFVVLIVIIGLGLYYALNFYLKANNINSTTSAIDTKIENQDSSAYFNPAYYSDKERKISGKIGKSYNQTDNSNLDFELLGNDGKTIAYIYSVNNDLNLSVGLTVEIQGEYRTTSVSGKEVIEVKSIKLK